jgi:tetratricopeptide (TPR) repeat protein
VSIDADIAAIRQRYLKIAYRLHPDTCKAETQAEKQRANDLLSKLVNPAYENLSKEQSRQEFRFILGQIGKDLPKTFSKISLGSENAKKLRESNNNVDLAYNKFLQSLAVDQYNTLDLIFQKIAQISELNLVYLMLNEGQNRKKIAQSTTVMASVDSKSAEAPSNQTAKTPGAIIQESPMTVYIRRAQDHLSRNNPTQAILEIKDALKIDPNDITCHALLGLAYLRQNQTSMAKVHINHAWNANPTAPLVLQSKRELDQILSPPQGTQAKKSKKTLKDKSGSFWSMFGGKKNSSK